MADDKLWNIAQHAWRTGAKEPARMGEYLAPQTFAQCVGMPAECHGRIVTSGCGAKEITALLPAFAAKEVKLEREADGFNMLATMSTLAVVAYFDAVCIALMHETGYTKDQFAVIHRGGAVRERLAAKSRPEIGLGREQ